MAQKKTQTTDETFDNNSEASKRYGVRPKGTAPPPKAGAVKVKHERTGFKMSMLNKFTLMILTADTLAGEVMIYLNVSDPQTQAHLMWAWGITHLIAAVPVLFNKRE